MADRYFVSTFFQEVEMGIKVTRGEITVEIDYDSHFPEVLSAVMKVLDNRSLKIVHDPFAQPRNVSELVDEMIGESHTMSAGPDVSRALRSSRPTRMSARQAIEIALTETQKLMTPDQLHNYMSTTNPRYAPKGADPVHNIKQVLRNPDNDFMEIKPGMWQVWTWQNPNETDHGKEPAADAAADEITSADSKERQPLPGNLREMAPSIARSDFPVMTTPNNDPFADDEDENLTDPFAP